jgi:Fe-coproporphyrin III synthase
MINLDMKFLLRLSVSGISNILRRSAQLFFLPSVTMYLTSACTYNCVMCDCRASNIDINRQEMSLEIIEKIFKDISAFWIKPRIHFSGGGEPMAHSKFSEILDLCAQYKLKWSMTTNGTLLNKYAEKIVDSNCWGLNLSFYGTKKEHHNITGVEGSYDVVLNGLKELEQWDCCEID